MRRAPMTLPVFMAAWLATAAQAGVVISELMYNPASGDQAEEFLELHNTDDATVDLAGWYFDGIELVFPAGAEIAPESYLVIAADSDQFAAVYGFAPDYVYANALGNSGEWLRLFDATDALIDDVEYADGGFWPVLPDGLGPSLEVVDPTEDNSTPRNWRAAVATAGHTAGAVNSVDAVGLPPWISNASWPMEPAPDDPILVTAIIADATQVELTYIVDFGDAQTLTMLDDGQSGDGPAGDGVYAATVPGQPAAALLRLRVAATGPTGVMDLPRDDDTVSYTGTMVADPTLSTALPVMQWFMHPDDYQAALDHYLTDDLEPALLYYDGVLYDNIAVRVRGQSSRSWPKKNWKFIFPQGHDFSAPELVELAVDQFNLQSNYSDKSYVRQVLAFETFRDAGHPSNQAFPVRLHQNGAFYGLYTFVDAVDDDYLKRNNLDENGAWYKAFDDCGFRPIEQLVGRYEKKTRLYEDHSDLFELLDGVNNLSGAARRNFLFDNIDIPGMLNYLAATCIIHNNDHPRKNYFLYRDTEQRQRWVMHPWDLDLTFGRNYGAGGGVLSDGIWADDDDVGREDVSPSHPFFGDSEHQKWDYLWNRLIDALYAEPEIRTMYLRRLRTLMDTLLVEDAYEQRIDELVPLIEPETALDHATWGQYGESQTMVEAVAVLTNEYLAVRRTHLFETHRVPDGIPRRAVGQPDDRHQRDHVQPARRRGRRVHRALQPVAGRIDRPFGLAVRWSGCRATARHGALGGQLRRHREKRRTVPGDLRQWHLRDG